MSIIYVLPCQSVSEPKICEDAYNTMVQNHTCLLARLMTLESVNDTDLSQYTNLFLSCCQLFIDKVYIADGSNPFWLSKGFFITI